MRKIHYNHDHHHEHVLTFQLGLNFAKQSERISSNGIKRLTVVQFTSVNFSPLLRFHFNNTALTEETRTRLYALSPSDLHVHMCTYTSTHSQSRVTRMTLHTHTYTHTHARIHTLHILGITLLKQSHH